MISLSTIAPDNMEVIDRIHGNMSWALYEVQAVVLATIS